MKLLQILGRKTLDFFQECGQISRLLWEIIKHAPSLIKNRRNFVYQMEHIGVNSVPLVFIIAIFTGAVAAWQAAYQLKGIAPMSFLGAAVSRAIITELAPVLTGIVIAGRVGASIAAEIGTMKVTEQIDAMQVSGTNPFKYLVVTRDLAATLMLPILAVFADAIGLLGAFAGVNIQGVVSTHLFFSQIFQSVEFADLLPAISKTVFFGFAIGLIGCYKGYNSNNGTEGVGKAANSAVVFASLMVFLIDVVAVQITSLIQP